MKFLSKLKLIAILAFALAGFVQKGSADVFGLSGSKEYIVQFSSQSGTGFTGTTTYMLIDLSNTSTWPHKEKGAVHITSVQTEIDKAAASTTTIRIGVVNYVGVSTGSITWFIGRKSEQNVSNTNVIQFNEYPNLGIYAKAIAPNGDTDGTTPFILSTEKTSGSSAFKQNTNIPTILGGSAFPAVGDIVIELTKGATAINYNIRVKYFTEN